MESSSAITGVAEIVLNVRDLPAMVRFYEDVLGFRLLSQACHETGMEPDPEGEPTIAFLVIQEMETPLGRHGHPQLFAVIDYRRHAFARGRFMGHDQTTSPLNHLAFEIPPEAHESERARLEGLGLCPRVTDFPGMSAKALFFNDPEGNTLELICHAPEL